MHRGRGRPRGTTRAAAALCSAAGLLLTPPALAEPGDPSGTTTPTAPEAWATDEDSPVGDANDTPLSGTTLEKQIAEADRLAADLAEGDREIATAVKELKSYSTKANRLLQRTAEARDEYDSAKKSAAEAATKLKGQRHRLTEGREGLRSWAFDTYTHASGYSDAMTLIDTLGHRSRARSAGDLGYLTDERIHQVDLVREDTATQATLTKKQERAKKEAATAKRRADRAKKDADAVLKDRKERLESLREKHSEELEEAGPVVNALVGVRDDEAKGASSRLTSTLEGIGEDGPDVEGAEPCSTNTASYPNGRIPPNALCPLPGAPGERLRPDAAAAFTAMSAAYERDTGHTLCVTDSYRSYAQQVVTKSDRGSFAATPGKSNHGLGKAVDLCGGVNDFGHPAHQWMQQNAPLYGWFHPSWAGADGSLPEPWHWEFSG